MIIEMWDDGLEGKLLAIILLVMFGGIVAVLGWLIYGTLDSVFLPTKVASAVIKGRSYKPAHTSIRMQQCGKTTVPVTVHHPESWEVELEVPDGRHDTIECSSEEYERAAIGKKAAVRYSLGRFSKDLYIKNALWD